MYETRKRQNILENEKNNLETCINFFGVMMFESGMQWECSVTSV